MGAMAKQGSGAASKEEKKAAKQAAKAARKERFSQIWQAFQMQRREDKALLPLMIGAVVVSGLVLFAVGLLIGQQWFLQTGKQSVNLASINMGVLRRFPVPLPPAEEQTQIVAEVERRLSVVEATL